MKSRRRYRPPASLWQLYLLVVLIAVLVLVAVLLLVTVLIGVLVLVVLHEKKTSFRAFCYGPIVPVGKRNIRGKKTISGRGK